MTYESLMCAKTLTVFSVVSNNNKR